MGYNTTVIFMNDALTCIKDDPNFGRRLYDAIQGCGCHVEKPVDVSSLGFANAATVIDIHHADQTALIAVGGNYATVVDNYWGWKHHSLYHQKEILKAALKNINDKIKADPSLGVKPKP
jgi:hypothetical protein